jgi:hypothetical protein
VLCAVVPVASCSALWLHHKTPWSNIVRRHDMRPALLGLLNTAPLGIFGLRTPAESTCRTHTPFSLVVPVVPRLKPRLLRLRDSLGQQQPHLPIVSHMLKHRNVGTSERHSVGTTPQHHTPPSSATPCRQNITTHMPCLGTTTSRLTSSRMCHLKKLHQRYPIDPLGHP